MRQRKNAKEKTQKTIITPGHHTPILNGSSSSTVNSRRLALKHNILLLKHLQTKDVVLKKNKVMHFCVRFKNSKKIVNFQSFIKQGRNRVRHGKSINTITS